MVPLKHYKELIDDDDDELMLLSGCQNKKKAIIFSKRPYYRTMMENSTRIAKLRQQFLAISRLNEKKISNDESIPSFFHPNDYEEYPDASPEISDTDEMSIDDILAQVPPLASQPRPIADDTTSQLEADLDSNRLDHCWESVGNSSRVKHEDRPKGADVDPAVASGVDLPDVNDPSFDQAAFDVVVQHALQQAGNFRSVDL